MIANLTVTIAYIKSHGYDFPKKMNIANRIGGFVLCPLACGICCCWSTTWRFIACPFQCIGNGCAYACSDNGCTTMTDKCISECVNQLNEAVEPITPATHAELNNATLNQLNSLWSCITDLYVMFDKESSVLMSKRYKIAENLIDPLMITFELKDKLSLRECAPYMACTVIAHMVNIIREMKEQIKSGPIAESVEVAIAKFANVKHNKIVPVIV